MSITAYADELFRLLSMTMYLWISRSAIQYKYNRTETAVKVDFSSLINDQRDTHLILK